MNGTEENDRDRDRGRRDLIFDIRRSVRYHTKRRQFFGRLGKFIKVFTVIGGLGTVTTLLTKAGELWTLAYGTLAGISSIIDLVIGTDEMARLHSDLAREFITLERRMVLAGNEITDKQLAEFIDQRLEIESKEPPVLHVLNVICHNELAKAMGYPKSEQSKKLTRLQIFFAPFCDISAHSLEKQES